MFSLFKRKPSIAAEPTFKTRVQRFWQWYASVGARFYQSIEARKCPDLAPEVSAKVDEMLPGLAWVFGPGPERRGHSFTMSGEGVIDRQLLSIYWHAQAPSLEGWTFYPSRQPGEIAGKFIEIGGQRFDPLEFWLSTYVNRDSEKVDITVWHPVFKSMPEKDRFGVLFLFLDEALGEYGTQQWIGEIKLNDGKLNDAMPLQELGDFLKKVQVETGWEKLPPGELTVLYRLEDPHDRFPRGDIVVGQAVNMDLIERYLAAEGELKDPLAGSGADYVFISFDAAFLPRGEESRARGAIEDALQQALVSAASGRVLGGAYGARFSYIDLLIFDGTASLEIIKQVLREQNLPAGTAINFFAKEKRGWRVVLGA